MDDVKTSTAFGFETIAYLTDSLGRPNAVVSILVGLRMHHVSYLMPDRIDGG